MPHPIAIDTNKLVSLYQSGRSCQDLASIFGTSDTTLRRRLKALGVTIRQGPEYRTTDTEETKVRRAVTRSAMTLHAGPTEDIVAAFLDRLGVGYAQQTVAGHYNIDFTLTGYPVAVEVVTGSGNPRLRENRGKRIEFIRSSGLHLIEFIANLGAIKAAPTLRGAEKLVALAQSLGTVPPTYGQYWMLRADGEPYAPRSRASGL